ncbi:MAG: hypothetical protein IPN18_15415 [Ignavibacteriales bacterium]|nr:hypothetical protein [Ignavibacteriales bacterium]
MKLSLLSLHHDGGAFITNQKPYIVVETTITIIVKIIPPNHPISGKGNISESTDSTTEASTKQQLKML